MSERNRLPTAEEIGSSDPRDVDAPWAVKHFHGKTLEEAEALFGHYTSLTYTEDFYSMGPVGLRFYLQSAIRYAKSERSRNDPDFINGLAGALYWRLKQDAQELLPCAPMLVEGCGYILAHFSHYGADPQIYTGLRKRYRKLMEMFTRMAEGQSANA